MERFLLGDLLVLRDLDHETAVDAEEASAAPRMGGLPLRSLATFSLGGRACRSGVAEVAGVPTTGPALPPPVDLVVASCPVSVWRLPEWHVGDWTVVHLVLVARDGADVPREVHGDVLEGLQVEHRGSPLTYVGGGSSGGGDLVQFMAELPGALSDVEVSLQPLARPGETGDPVRL